MYHITRRFPRWEESKSGIILPKSKNIAMSIKMKGVYKFHSIKNGIKTQIDEKENLIMDDVYYRMVRAFLGYTFASYYYITHCAIGTDNTAVAGTDTTLGTEVFRSPYVALTNLTNSTVDATFYITSTDYTGDIEEVGIFGGDDATDSADTGNLLSHVLWSYSKTIDEELLIEYVLTLS